MRCRACGERRSGRGDAGDGFALEVTDAVYFMITAVHYMGPAMQLAISCCILIGDQPSIFEQPAWFAHPEIIITTLFCDCSSPQS
jgi:hypothetical protein